MGWLLGVTGASGEELLLRKGSAVAFSMCAVVLAVFSGLAAAISHGLVDARFRLFEREATGTVALVAIDPKSIDKIGVWPWPRTVHAELLEKLGAMGVADIVFDVDFSSRSTDAADTAFADALRRAQGSVVLASFVQGTDAGLRLERRPLAEFRQHSWLAVANISPDSDGLIRRYSFGGEIDGRFEPTMGAMVAGIHRADGGSFGIDYSIRVESIPTVSIADVLAGKIAASELAGKKVVIGATAIELGDRFNVPNGKIIPGTALQVLAAETLLQGRALYWTSHIVAGVGLAAVVLILIVGRRCLQIKGRLGLLAGTSVVVEAAATLVQVEFAVVADTSTWHVALAAGVIAALWEELDFRSLMARLSEARFRHMARAVGEGLVCTDHTGKVLYWNPGASRIFGLQSRDVSGRSILECIAERSNEDLAHVLRQGLSLDSNVVIDLIGRRVTGEEFALEAGASCWSHDGRCQFVFVFRDVTVRKQEEARIRFLAEHDPMTGLINRSKLFDVLNLLVRSENARRLDVVILGIDGLRGLNDVLGQDRGNRALVEIACELERIWSGIGQVARLDGNEFAVVIPGSTSSADVLQSRIKSSLAFTVLGDRPVTVTLCGGSSSYPADGATADLLIANAGLALSEAKARSARSYAPYRAELREVVERNRKLEAELKGAYERGEFELFYQPQVSLDTGRVIGAEALIRWRHPERGLISPGQFIPVLEASPLAGAVGRWVIDEAIGQTARWHKCGHDFRVGINLSQSVLDDSLPWFVAERLALHDCPARLVELEITETIALEDDENTTRLLRELRACGIHIAFDDFGTGFASLTTLKRFPLDRLKIDQSFVRQMLTSQDDRSIVTAVIGLARLLGLHVIAEGIEDEATAAALTELGCEEGQGYHFGRPMTSGDFSKRFAQGLVESNSSLQQPIAAAQLCVA